MPENTVCFFLEAGKATSSRVDDYGIGLSQGSAHDWANGCCLQKKKKKNRTLTIQVYPIQLLLVEMALKLLEYRPSVPEIKWTRAVCHIPGSTYGLDVIHGSG